MAKGARQSVSRAILSGFLSGSAAFHKFFTEKFISP